MLTLLQKRSGAAARYAGEIVRFVIAGSLAAATHLVTLYVLTEFTALWYLEATVIGFGLGFLVSFTLQKYWTFQERTKGRMAGQLTQFFLLQASGLVVNTAGLFVLVEYLGLWYFAAQAGLLVVVAGGTYAISKWIIFNHPASDAPFSIQA